MSIIQTLRSKTIQNGKPKKVALLGTVPHKMMAPFADKDFEIWAIAHSCLGEPLPKVDRIFEIHKWDEVVKWGSLNAFAMFPNAPKYLIEKRDDVQNAIAFPFKEISEKFKIFHDRPESHMTNSISWMIALAILEGFEEIHIYGVNMSHHTEYGTQKPSCEYYLGLAKGLGIKIYVPAVSDLLKSNFLYGLDEEKQSEISTKVQERKDWLTQIYNQHLQQKAQMNQQMAQVDAAIQQHVGAIEDCNFWLQHFKQ
jgi:hypothetical protein